MSNKGVVILLLFFVALGMVNTTVSFGATATAGSNTAATSKSKQEKIFEMKGKIYEDSDVPMACKSLHLGIECHMKSFGLFHAVSEKKADGTVYSVTKFSDDDGSKVIEETWMKEGKFTKGRLENRQLQYVTDIQVRDGSIFYEKKDREGKVKTSKETAAENLVMPSTLIAYLKPHMDKIESGKEVEVKMVVPERMESFTFGIAKEGVTKAPNGHNILILKMTASSFFVKLAVKPMFFYIDETEHKIVGFEGRSALQKQVAYGKDIEFKPIDARVAYRVLLQPPTEVDCISDAKSTGDLMNKEQNKCVITK